MINTATQFGYNDDVRGETTAHASFLMRLKDGGDSTAWREFNERYGRLIRGFARRRGLQPSDRDDVCQDVLLSLSGDARV